MNDGIVYRTDTGEVIDDSVVTRSVSAVMVLVDGAWKFASRRIIHFDFVQLDEGLVKLK